MSEEVKKELIDAIVVAIDLLGIDVKKAYPKLYNEFLTHQHEDKGEWYDTIWRKEENKIRCYWN